ncbi:hypothetical protein D9756_011171 [Leucocoprinus leucothites]|uniref:Nephrocystin 3-like N-terminal domain-containing protein n=1 Tax=Leucocoprinus leucothites TaxID=201217 RepID=A0A8H5CPM0_9AGAR|nr:hypothetical protein D9756_011171 [Leucoagaricus leucothites]
MFRGAHHLAIKDAYFIDNSTARSGLEILLSKSMPDAFHDSGARDPPPRCHLGTRQGYITKIVGWAHGNCDRNQPLLWMYGPFGVGKTAVAQSCADALESGHKLAASLFFSRSNADRDDPQRLFTSIAYQIATKCEEYCNTIEYRIRRDPAITAKSLSKQFKELFVHPLSQIDIAESGLEGRVVIVDGLDECRGTIEQRAIIDIITTSARNGTAPFRWFLTSRPEDHLVRSMNSESVSNISAHLELPVSRAIGHEILIFVTDEFKKIREDRGLSDSWPHEEVLSLLVRRAAGLFIFAATIVRFVSDDNSFGPQDQLRIVLEFLEGVPPGNGGQGNPLEEMDRFYTLIMQRIPSKLLTTVRKILLLKDLGLFSVYGTADYLSLSEEQFRGVCAYLQSVVELRDGPWFWHVDMDFYHASFLDFIKAPRRSKELCIYDIAGSLPGPTLIDDGTDLSVPEVLQNGTEMLKISDKNEKRVMFRPNPGSGHISYQSRKHGIVQIEAIKEIRTGGNTKYDHQ